MPVYGLRTLLSGIKNRYSPKQLLSIAALLFITNAPIHAQTSATATVQRRTANPLAWAAAKASGRLRQQQKGPDTSLHFYDAYGRLTKVLEPDAQNQPTLETDYAYDDLGNLTTITQYGAKGDTPRIRSFVYDANSHLISATNPETGTTTYTYNSDGTVASRTDARGITTTYAWDAKQRLTGKRYSDGTPSVVYLYADDSSRTLIGSYLDTPDGHKAERIYHYNAQGKLDHVTENSGQGSSSIDLQYDVAGNVTQITYPDGRVLRQLWDANGQLREIVSNPWKGQGSYAYFAGASYWPSGELHTAHLGNGVTIDTTYNSERRLSTFAVNRNDSRLLNKTYQYTSSGSIAAIADGIDPGNSLAYTYDTLDRVATATQPGGNFGQNFVYDAFGNLQQSDASSAHKVDAANRLDSSAGLTYDQAGDMTFDGTHHYAYDAEGQIVSVDEGVVQYLYSAEGDRIQKNVSGTATEYLWLQDKLLAEKHADGSWTDYIYANGERIASTGLPVSADENPLEDTVAPKLQSPTYYLADQLGVTRIKLSATGEVLSQGDFAPFGKELPKHSDSPTTIGTDAASIPFTGEEHDPETGLDRYKFRSYNAALGRWMSPDPSGLYFANLRNSQTLNLYAFVLNNPMKYVDPLGLDVCPDGTIADVCVDTTPVPGPSPSPDPGQGGACTSHAACEKKLPVHLLPQKPFDIPVVPANPCIFAGTAEPPSTYATEGQFIHGLAMTSPLSAEALNVENLANFRKGGSLDPQTNASGTVWQKAAYGNYVYGVYNAAAGFLTLSQTLAGANAYAAANRVLNPKQYATQRANNEMDSTYTELPEANVKNITNGYNAQQNGTTCKQ